MKLRYIHNGIVIKKKVAVSSDTDCNTSLIARTSQVDDTTTDPETEDVTVKKESIEETTGSHIPYSPSNPRRHGYKKVPWSNRITSNGKLTVVDILHGNEQVGTMFVDKADTDKVRYPVRIDKDGYAVNRGTPPQFVAHSILGFTFDPSVDKVVDHINKIKLDNRRKNLRVLTVRGNNLNHPCHSGNSTGIRGLNRDVYVDKDGVTRYEAYEAIIVNPRDPLLPPYNKAKQYRKKFYYGKNGIPESEARRAAESWLNQMSKKFERERLDMTVVGSTTIPGAGVGESSPKKEASDIIIR